MTPDPTGAAATRALAPPSLVGALIAGRYRLRRVIGRGGMGTVYKADNVAIGRTVAVKILHAHLADDPITFARFQREARAAASVGHEHIVEILDMGTEPSGAAYLVMEYVRGKSVARALREDGPMSYERAARIAGQVLAGLGAAHGAGIVHRDLKPENVMLTARGGRADFVKLFDFGVAAFVDAALSGADDLTPAGRAMGTPSYASPEQLLGQRVRDARVDLYAVGVLLFEMIAGGRPFEGRTLVELCAAVAKQPVPPLAVFVRDAPSGLDAVLGRSLAKAPGDRFQSAREMAQALEPFGAEPWPSEAEPTDTLTLELRELRARELSVGAGDRQPGPVELVRGEALALLLEFVRERLGEDRVQALLDRLVPELGDAIRGGVDPEGWYPGGTLVILEHADREAGRGDRRLVAEAGRFLARKAFARRQGDPLLAELTPELFFSHLPELWARYFAAGSARVTKLGRGYGRFEVTDMPDTFLARSVAVAGYVSEALILAGARDADVRLSAASALGDLCDVLEASWSSG